jgi:hypothetical protein
MNTWDQLPKNQSDNTTIETAIAEAIAAHNADSNAHLGTDGSLLAHKSDEVIDHPAGSVVNDKIPDNTINPLQFDRNQIYCIADWLLSVIYTTTIDTGGSATAGLGIMTLATGAVSGRKAIIDLAPNSGAGNTNQWTPGFQTVIALGSITNQTSYIGIGSYLHDFFGFKIVNGTAYAMLQVDGYSPVNHILGAIGTGRHTLKCIYFSATQMEFYINDILVYTATTGIPDDSSYQYHFQALTITNTSAAKSLLLFQTVYWVNIQGYY